MTDCQHRYGCLECRKPVDELHHEPDPAFDALLDGVLDEMATEIVSSVRVVRAGHHERVTVWIQGQNAGELTVGEGQGRALAALLLGERLARGARALVTDWRDQDGFNSSRLDELTFAVEEVDRNVRGVVGE